MNIEAKLLSKNRDAFNRVVTMMESLIVKDTRAAELAETTESLSAYEEYCHAFEGNDSVLDYQFTTSELLEVGFTPTQAAQYMMYPKKLQTLLIYGHDGVKALMKKKRAERIAQYVEHNPYYRPFCGLPADESEYIKVVNSDKVKDSDPDYIYLHQATYSAFPKTYNRLYYERDIDIIFKDYDFQYLKFIEEPMTPYAIRNKGTFDICYYSTNALNSNELDYFFEAYNTARQEIMTLDYIKAFEMTYSAYSNTMFALILYYTFNLFSVKILDRYAVRDYTDDEIYDILDSNGLSKLKTLNMSLLKRVVKYLPDIKANLGTQKIIDIIFDIVADNTLTVKRLYLTKKYHIDGFGNTIIKKDGIYSDHVDLVFKEKTIRQGSEASFTSDAEHEYLKIVNEDDTWGGTHGMSPDEKAKVKTQMKEQLLSADFATIMTKYIGISKVVDMYSKTVSANDKLGLFFQANSYYNNFLKDDTILYNGMEVTVLSIYAAWCLIYGTLNGLSDPDYIIKDISTIEGIMRLRKAGAVVTDAANISEITIDLGNGYNKKLGDYLTDEEISRYLVKFNYNQDTSIEEILKQYDDNWDIIKAIQDKLNTQSNYDEYAVWNEILKANQASSSINDLFGGFETYSTCIKARDAEFYKYIQTLSGNVDREALCRIAAELKQAFTDYVHEKTSGLLNIMTDENDATSSESLDQIAVLFESFLSCYDQLYSQESHVGYDDPGENSLVLLYAKMCESFVSSETEIIELIDRIVQDCSLSKDVLGYLWLDHYIYDTTKTENFEDLFLDYEFRRMETHNKEYTFLEFMYDKHKDIVQNKLKTNLILEDTIISIKEI